MSENTPEPVEVGWRVLDPDGNVVASGPGMILEAAGDAGEGEEHGGDRRHDGQ